MTPSARLAAAIEVMADIDARRRPAVDALKDWGLSHRFAGSGDRAAIAGLVYDALRRKSSSAFLMRGDAPRAILLGMCKLERGMDASAIARLASGERFAPEPLTESERQHLDSGSLAGAPAHVAGDYPEWLDPHLARTFGDTRAQEAEALSRRAPLDLRVNALKSDRDSAKKELAAYTPTPTPWSPVGLRIDLSANAKNPAIQSEPAFLSGAIEVQDEGSQIVSLLSGARGGEQVIDLCAGAGGKSLALAAQMGQRGQIYSTDLDKRRVAPIYARLERAGVRNVQVRAPSQRHSDGPDVLADLAASADLVLIDAPCTGTGTWRRNPDAKWRVRPGALEQRNKDQAEVLSRGAELVKPGGRIVYITCSVLTEENDDRVEEFLAAHSQFRKAAPDFSVLGNKAAEFQRAVLTTSAGIVMTPKRTGTDGFYFSLVRREG
jgi:16S rRNA (cytosine967-C5)-methyltransferase